MPISFDHTAFFWVAVLGICTLVWYRYIRREKLPLFYFSSLDPFNFSPSSFKHRYARLPAFFFVLGLLMWLIAFIDPHVEKKELVSKNSDKKANPSHFATEGIALYLVLDRSGSMATKIVETTSGDQYVLKTKMEELKSLTRTFIEGNNELGLQGRPMDLVGLVAFARIPEVLVPLTLDHQTVLNALDSLDVVKDLNQDGTAIGYAMYKTANLISALQELSKKWEGKGKAPYEIKGSAIVLVTDGFQSPHPDDKKNPRRSMGIEEAGKLVQQRGIHLYLISIDPAIDNEEYAPQRRLMTRVAEATGGRFYAVSDPAKLKSIYQDINILEKTKIPDLSLQGKTKIKTQEHSTATREHSFYPAFILAGLLCIALGLILKTTILRTAP